MPGNHQHATIKVSSAKTTNQITTTITLTKTSDCIKYAISLLLVTVDNRQPNKASSVVWHGWEGRGGGGGQQNCWESSASVLLHFRLLLAVRGDLSNASSVSQWLCHAVSASVDASKSVSAAARFSVSRPRRRPHGLTASQLARSR